MNKSSERLLAYVFGVVFVSAILALAVFVPEPKPFQYTVFRIVLALAAAGVATVISGFLTINLNTMIRAGGALAVFVIVYFFSPAQYVTSPVDNISEITLMDTYLSSKAYDPQLRIDGITNAHKINTLIEQDSDLQKFKSNVTIVGREFDGANDVMERNPELIIMHRSSFDWEGNPDRNEERLKRFLSSMHGTKSNFLIYSRKPDTNKLYAEALAIETGLEGRLNVFRFTRGNPWADDGQIREFIMAMRSEMNRIAASDVSDTHSR